MSVISVHPRLIAAIRLSSQVIEDLEAGSHHLVDRLSTPRP